MPPPSGTRWKRTSWPLERTVSTKPPSGVSLASEIASMPTPMGRCPVQVVPPSAEATKLVTSPSVSSSDGNTATRAPS